MVMVSWKNCQKTCIIYCCMIGYFYHDLLISIHFIDLSLFFIFPAIAGINYGEGIQNARFENKKGVVGLNPNGQYFYVYILAW